MKSPTPVRLCQLATLLVSLAGTLAHAARAQSAPEALTPAQQAAVDARISTWMAQHGDDVSQQAALYLADHPAFFQAARESLQQEEQYQLRQMLAQQALAARDTLLAPGALPQSGVKNAAATVVVVRMFPDAGGRQLEERLKAFRKVQSGVQVRWLDLPGPQSGSTQAAVNALLAWKQGGEKSYTALTDAQMQGTGTDGVLTPDDLKQALHAAHLAPATGDTLKALSRQAQQQLMLARTLRVRQVPVVLVLPAQGQSLKRVSVFVQGIPSLAQLSQAWQAALTPAAGEDSPAGNASPAAPSASPGAGGGAH